MGHHEMITAFESQLQQSAARAAAIKNCRIAQTRAYAAQKAASVPQDSRCKQPQIGPGTSLAQIQALTAGYEQIVAHPRLTNSRRDILAKRVEFLTGDRPGPSVSIEEMLETIEDYATAPAARKASSEGLPRFFGGERSDLTIAERDALEISYRQLLQDVRYKRVTYNAGSQRSGEMSDRALRAALTALQAALTKHFNRTDRLSWRYAS